MSADQNGEPEVTVEPLASAGDAELLELAGLSLGAGPTDRTSAYWRWKHHENPFGPSLGLVARASTGELAAMRVFMRWEWLCGDERVPAVRAVDTATHPDHRRRGLFRRLTLEALEIARDEGVEFVFNTPNAASLPGYLRMGWELVARVPLMIRPLRPMRAAFGLLGLSRRPGHTDPHEGNAVESTAWDSLPPLPDDSRLHTPAEPDYLSWRFLRPPRLEYRLEREPDGGAVVMSRERARRGLSELSISAVLTTPEGVAGAAAALRRVLRTSSAHYAVACAAPDTPERRALLRAGFFPSPVRGPVLTARRLASTGPVDPTVWQNWRPHLADLELF